MHREEWDEISECVGCGAPVDVGRERGYRASDGQALCWSCAVAYTPGGETVLRTSVLAPYLLVVSDLFNRLAPQDLAERYRDGVDELRRLWSDADEVL